MSEFADLGKHCSDQLCRQQDFLPFTCADCQRVFCREHRSHHNCLVDRSSLNTMPQCPICSQFVHVRADADVNAIVEQHISSGCKSHLLNVSAVHKDKKLTCALRGCKKVELIPIRCDKCRLTFCLSHRFPDDHQCTGMVQNGVAAQLGKPKSSTAVSNTATAKGASTASKPVSSSSSKSTSSSQIAVSIPATPAAPAAPAAASSNDSIISRIAAFCAPACADSSQKQLSPHIRVMQMKARAVGADSIAPEDRLYYQICIAPDVPRTGASPAAALPVFLSRRHTLGKCLDSICQYGKVVNRNNEAGARKLILSPPGADVCPLPFDMALETVALQFPSGSSLCLALAP